MFGIHWTMPSVVGPQWIIDGEKATPSEISWFGNIIAFLFKILLRRFWFVFLGQSANTKFYPNTLHTIASYLTWQEFFM